jgi:hypothetical protein
MGEIDEIMLLKEKSEWSKANRIIVLILIVLTVLAMAEVLVSVLVPKSLIADTSGGKSQVEYSVQGVVQVAIEEKIVVDYDPVTGRANGNHTVYTYTDCLWFKPDDNLFSPNYMLIPDYLLEKTGIPQ